MSRESGTPNLMHSQQRSKITIYSNIPSAFVGKGVDFHGTRSKEKDRSSLVKGGKHASRSDIIHEQQRKFGWLKKKRAVN